MPQSRLRVIASVAGLLVVALLAGAMPPAMADPVEDAEAAPREAIVVSLDAPLTLGESSWSWGPSATCTVAGGLSGTCGWSMGGGYGPPAGVGGGCLASRQGVDGAGTLTVIPSDPTQPQVTVSVTHFGWEVAHGRAQGEVAVLSGSWSDGEREGGLRGFVAATALSSNDCGMYATSARPKVVLVLSPSAVPDDTGNAAPDVPALVAPGDGHVFAWDAEKQLTIRTADPDGDPYVGEVEISKSPGRWPAFTVSALSSPAASDSESTAFLPLAVEGSYQWRARACDPSGSGACSGWTSWRAFGVQTSPVEQVGAAAAAEAEATRTVRLEAGVSFGADSWSWGPSVSCEYVGGTGRHDSCGFSATGAYGPPAGVGTGCFAERQGRDGTGELRVDDGSSSTTVALDLLEWRAADGAPGAEAAVVSGRWRQSGREGRVTGLATVSSTDPNCTTYATGGKPRVVLQLLPATLPAPEANDPPALPDVVVPAEGQRFAWDEDKRFVVATSDPDEDPYYGEVEVTRTDPAEVGEVDEDVPTVTLVTTPAALGGAAAAAVPHLQAGSYTARARACDPSGSGECSGWTDLRNFSVESSPPEDTGEEAEFEIAQTRGLEMQGPITFGDTTWTWQSDTCRFADGEGQGLHDTCRVSVTGTYGPAAGVGGGCLAQKQGRDGRGTLTVSVLGRTPVSIELDRVEWRVAEGVTGAEMAVVSGRWARGRKEGRISGFIANTSLAVTSNCAIYQNAAQPRAVMQVFPSTVPAPIGNLPPASPTLVAPEDGRSFPWDDDKRLEIRATDQNGDPYHGLIEVQSQQRPLTFTLSSTPAHTDGHSWVLPPTVESGEYAWRAKACDPSGSAECSPWSHEWDDAPRFTVQRSIMEDGIDHAEEDAAQFRSFSVRAPLDLGASSWTWGPGGSCAPNTSLIGGCSFSASGSYGSAAGAGPGCFTQKQGVDGSGTLTYFPDPQGPVTLTISDFAWELAEGRAGSEMATISGRWTAGNRHGVIRGLAASHSTSTDCALYAGGGAPTMVLDFLPDDLVVGGGTQQPPGVPVLVTPDAEQTWWTTDRQTFRIRAEDPNRDFYVGEIEVRPIGEDGTPGAAHEPFSTTPSRSGLTAEAVRYTDPFPPGRYEWRARASDPLGSDQPGGWSGWRGFTLADTADLPAYLLPESDRAGLEQFYPYRAWKLGTATAYANLASGNLVVQGSGVEVPGPLGLRVTHTYNAVHDQVDGPIGKGWTLGVQDFDAGHSDVVGALLALDLTGALTVIGTDDRFEFIDADGTRHRFLKGGLSGPGWHAPPGINLTVTDGLDTAGNRWYQAVRPDGVRYEFAQAGEAQRLTRIVDRKGNELTFAYAAGKLSTITDTSGRTLTFVWTGERVTTTRYTAGATTYDVTYDVDAAGRLTSVIRAAGTTGAQATTFAYTEGLGLTGVTDARGGTTGFTYVAGRLATVTDRAGKPWQIQYGELCGPGRDAGVTPVCVVDPPDAPGEDHVTAYGISPQGNMIELRDAGDFDELGQPRRNTRSFVWADNRLRRMTDEARTVTDYEYNSLGLVTRQTVTPLTEQGIVTELDYHSPTQGVADLVEARVGVGSGDQRTWKFGYDEAGKGLLVSQTDPGGAQTQFAYYAARGFLKSVTDPRGKSITYGDTALSDGSYHESGQPAKIIDPAGAVITLTYDAFGRVSQKVDRLGKTWTYTHDARGNLLSETNPANAATQATRYCYDANDNRTHVIRPKAASGSCAQTGTEGHVTVTTYDARDLATLVTTSSGAQIRKTRHAYAGDGQLLATFHPRSFDPTTGAELTDPAQIQKAAYDYYPNNRLRAFIDPEGNRTDVVHTPAGQPRQVTDPAHHASDSSQRRSATFTYDWRGQETRVLVSGHPGATRHEYNLHGEKTRITTPTGRVTQFDYDRMGRQTRSIDAHGRASQRTYDPVGNLSSVTQPVGSGGTLTTAYTYTDRNEIASETDPADSRHLITYSYDAEGRQVLRNDVRNGIVTRSIQETRRDDGLVTERSSFFSGTTTGMHRGTFIYDAHGNTTAVNTYLDGAATPNLSAITADYTTADEIATWTETLHPTSGSGVTKTSSFTYAPDGAMASRTVDAKTTSYTHWRNGLEKTTVPWDSSGTVSSTWMPNASPNVVSQPGGVSTTYTYDAAARISSKRVAKGTTSLSSWQQVTYDGDDNRTGELVSQVQPGGATKMGTGTFAYDRLGRLVSAKHPLDTASSAKTYVLDDAGNIVNDGKLAYTYSHNRLTRSESLEVASLGASDSYSYDATGNMVSQCCQKRTQSTEDGFTVSTSRSVTFGYDGSSQTSRVQVSVSETYDHPLLDEPITLSSSQAVYYAYDALGRLVRRNQDGATTAAATELFFHDHHSQQVALETDGAGAVATRYVLDSTGAPIGQQKGAVFGWYVTDLRANLTQVLDATGAVKSVFGYDPFGKDKSGLTSVSGGFDSRLRYQMAPRDKTVGMYALGPRLLDPGINRFVGADSYVAAAANMQLALDPLTGNRYLYAGANPAGLVDDGHSPGPSCRAMARATITEYLTGVACPPSGFAQYLGYTPALISLPWGNRFARQNGACSSPTLWVTWHYGFTTACLTHDYGYDLIRYFRATGRTADEGTRFGADRLFRDDLRATCSNRFGTWSWHQIRARVHCYAWAEAYYRVVRGVGGFVFDEPVLKRRD